MMFTTAPPRTAPVFAAPLFLPSDLLLYVTQKRSRRTSIHTFFILTLLNNIISPLQKINFTLERVLESKINKISHVVSYASLDCIVKASFEQLLLLRSFLLDLEDAFMVFDDVSTLDVAASLHYHRFVRFVLDVLHEGQTLLDLLEILHFSLVLLQLGKFNCHFLSLGSTPEICLLVN
jgi:hypothetical protein